MKWQEKFRENIRGMDRISIRGEVNHMKEFTMIELDAVEVELLPAREALGVFDFAAVYAQNSSLAANVLSVGSVAASSANQVIIVSQ